MDIQFCLSNYQFLERVRDYKELQKELEKADVRLKLIKKQKDPELQKTLIDKKKKTLDKIERARAKYYQEIRQDGLFNQPVGAFVTFRSMEGARRAMDAFDYSFIHRVLLFIFPCCSRQKVKKIKFANKFLKVERAPEPDLLIWENLGLPWWEHHLRGFIFLVFFVGILFSCFYSIVALEERGQFMNAKVNGF
jgi:hypothetical protein